MCAGGGPSGARGTYSIISFGDRKGSSVLALMVRSKEIRPMTLTSWLESPEACLKPTPSRTGVNSDKYLGGNFCRRVLTMTLLLAPESNSASTLTGPRMISMVGHSDWVSAASSRTATPVDRFNPQSQSPTVDCEGHP